MVSFYSFGGKMNIIEKEIRFENFMEVLVDEALEDLFKVTSLQFCRCERCYLDAKSIALNRLPPKYIVTRTGEIYAKLDIFRNQFRVDVLKAAIEAIEIVKKNPSHL